MVKEVGWSSVRAHAGLVAAIAAALILQLASAQAEPARAPGDAPPEPGLDEAKRLFRQGNELRRAGDCERALEYFLESRALVPSAANTLNAAVCLESLGRIDEAAEHFEALLTDHRGELTEAEHAAVGATLRRLRGQLGGIEVVANVDGTLIIDGRPRGKLPRLSPVRVVPGHREVRVLKDGYESFETAVEVEAGRTVRAVAELVPLSIAGRLRVDDPRLLGAEVIVDDAPLGVVPWEGTLSPGEHRLVVQRGDFGTAPVRVIVVEGQTALAELSPGPLGRPLRIAAEPASADIAVGGVPIGRGRWQGRLPLGAHRVEVAEEGYLPHAQTLQVSTAGPHELAVALEVDRSHPRWGVIAGRFFATPSFGMAIAPAIGSGAEASCATAATTCSSAPTALGLLVTAAVGYEFPNRVSLSLLAGYLRLGKTLSRQRQETVETDGSPNPTPAVYELEDDLRLSGPIAGLGVGYRHRFGSRFELQGRLSSGLLLAFARDRISATATAEGELVEVVVPGSGSTARAADLFLLPELFLVTRGLGLEVGLGVAVPMFLLEGPANPHGEARVDPSGCDDGVVVACASQKRFTAGERTFGRFVAVVPSLRVGYFF